MLESVSEAPLRVIAGVGGAASGVGAIVVDQISLSLGGVPLSVVLAAFAGAGGVLAFLPTMPALRAIGTAAFAGLASVYSTPWAAAKWSLPPLMVALAFAAGLQIGLPLLIQHKDELWKRLLALLPGSKGG